MGIRGLNREKERERDRDRLEVGGLQIEIWGDIFQARERDRKRDINGHGFINIEREGESERERFNVRGLRKILGDMGLKREIKKRNIRG